MYTVLGFIPILGEDNFLVILVNVFFGVTVFMLSFYGK